MELDLCGFSESQIAKELGVSQQTVSRYLNAERERVAQLRGASTLHTIHRSYAQWCNLLQYFWQLSKEAEKKVNLAEQRKIGEDICKVQLIMDERFLSTVDVKPQPELGKGVTYERIPISDQIINAAHERAISDEEPNRRVNPTDT